MRGRLMYDYETIKKNFEKIKAKEILTYKQKRFLYFS